ncbi:hypothetical protein BDW68DRAFT_137549 [Aspergillus falconensis]
MSRAKRVILRVPEIEMDYQNPREFVDFYFTKFPSDAASDSARHFIHYQPPSIISQPNAKVHIVIDLETRVFAGPLTPEFPHEIYAVRRGTDEPKLYAYTEPAKRNLLQKIREYSDSFYPWGQSRSNQKAEFE